MSGKAETPMKNLEASVAYRENAITILERTAKRSVSSAAGMLKLAEDLRHARLRPESEEALWTILTTNRGMSF